METEHRLPPSGFVQTLRQLGPGMILSGSIVGSGELIATTTLGARVGFAALWLILVSCLVKVVVQEQLGRYTVITGETTFRALDKVPGPRWRTSWVVWCWMFMFVGVTFQQGGIIGGTAQVFNLMFPHISVLIWTIVIAAVTVILLAKGRYRFVEAASTVMVVGFTFITMGGAILLIWTPYAVGLRDVTEGLKFHFPAGGLAVAFAVFGITGVGATELIYYPYWCLEKGYARFTGRNDQSAAWLARARAWVRIMRIDALVAMVVYTLATAAFYILGASVLHGMGKIPAGYDMVRTLSNIYTTTFGEWAFYLFLLGAFFVLYSTTFSANASNARVVTDFFELIGIIKVGNDRQRQFWQRLVIAVLLPLYVILYWLLGEPVTMVVIGGVAQACMLPIIGLSTLYLSHQHMDPTMRPGLLTYLLLWLCSILMLAFAIYVLFVRLRG